MKQYHTITMAQMPCQCHCTMVKAAFCAMEKASRDPSHKKHEEAKKVLGEVLEWAMGPTTAAPFSHKIPASYSPFSHNTTGRR